MASSFLQKKAEERARKVAKEFGSSTYGGVSSPKNTGVASDFLRRKAEERSAVSGLAIPPVKPTTPTLATPKVDNSKRIGELKTEIRSLGNQISTMRSGLSRAKAYGNTESLEKQLEEKQKEMEKLQAELFDLREESAETSEEKAEVRLERAKAEYKKAQGALPAGEGAWRKAASEMAGSSAVRDEYVKKVEKKVEAEKELDTAQRVVDRDKYVEKYEGKTFEDNFFGQTGANYTLGRLSQDSSLAWNEYLNNPTEENRKYAESIDAIIKEFMTDNEATLADDGTLRLISQSGANYLPQFLDQTKYSAVGGLTGALAGTAVAPGVGTKVGLKAGIVAGSGLYSYNTMRGAAFKTLLELGVDEETAKAAASDEAVISSIIEMGDTAIDIFSLGTTKLLTAVGKEGLKGLGTVLTKWAGESAAKNFALALGKYGLNIFSEGIEEGLQQAVSIANQERIANGEDGGAWDLTKRAASVLWDAITGKNPEAAAEIKGASVEGMKIATLMGGVDAATTATSTAIYKQKVTKVGENIRSAYKTDDFLMVVKEKADPESEAHKTAQTYIDRINAGGKDVTAFELGSLFLKAEEEAKAKSKADTKTQQADAETETLVEMAQSEDAATAEYATEQLANPDKTVVSPIAKTLIDSGMKAADAVEQAAVLMKLQSGQALTKSERNSLNLKIDSVRTAFTEITGETVTDGQARNASESRQIIRRAEEVAKVKADTVKAEKAREAAVEAERVKAEAEYQQAQAQAMSELQEGAIEQHILNMAEKDVAREEARAAEPQIVFEDGTTATLGEFEKAYLSKVPNAATQDIVTAFHEYQTLNEMGKKVPGTASRVADSITANSRSSVSESKNAEAQKSKTTAPPFTPKSETAKAESKALSLKRLNNIASKFGVTVKLAEPGDADLVEGENGYYDHAKKTVVLNSKVATNQFLMTYYFVHEITHAGQMADADVKTGLTADIISAMERIYGKGKVKAMIADTRKRYENHYKKTGKDTAVLDKANFIEDEVASDFMMKAIGDTRLLDILAGVTPKPHQALIAKIRNFLKGKKSNADGVAEARRLMKRMQESLARATEKSTGAVKGDSVKRHSIDTLVEAVGLSYEKGEDGATVFRNAKGEPVSSVAESQVKNSPLGAVIQSAVDAEFISKSDAEKQVKFFSDLFNLMLETNDIDLIWAVSSAIGFNPVEPGARDLSKADTPKSKSRFNALTSNADKQYSTTVDFTTICLKTKAIIDVMSETMVRLERGLTESEIIDVVYKEVYESGEPVPCPVCYVFSRWVGLGGLFDKMWNNQQKYANADTEAIWSDVLRLEEQIQEILARKGEGAKRSAAKDSLYKEMRNRRNELLSKDTLNRTSDGAPLTAEERTELNSLTADLEILDDWSWLTRVRLDPQYKPVPADVLFDINKGKEFAEQYPRSWSFRTTRGPAMGKAATPYAAEHLGQVLRGLKDSLGDQTKNPFLKAKTGKLSKTAQNELNKSRLKVKVQNLLNGQRFQSTSDFRFEYALDYLLVLTEMQALGSKVQLYTKVPEAVRMLASCGAEVNCSLMPLGVGYDENGNLLFSSVTGMNPEDAFNLSAEFDNVQPIMVGTSDKHILLCMADDRITFIIPYHASGAGEARYVALMEIVGEDIESRDDYSLYQTDHEKTDATPMQKAARDLRKRILTGKAETLTAEDVAVLKDNTILHELYKRFYGKNADGVAEAIDPKYLAPAQRESATTHDEECFGVFLTADQASTIMPFEYWDRTTTRDRADENSRAFVEYCESLGLHPRFSGYDSKGKYHAEKDFSKISGYWKMLGDRKLYNNDGTYHEQQAINISNFNAAYLTREESVKGIVQPSKMNDPNAVSSITDKVVEKLRYSVSPEQDTEYMTAVQNDDMETAQRMVDEYAIRQGFDVDEDGEPDLLFHGTDSFGFTKTDTSKSDDNISFWATPNMGVAGSYYEGSNYRVREIGKEKVSPRGEKLTYANSMEEMVRTAMPFSDELGINLQKVRYVKEADVMKRAGKSMQKAVTAAETVLNGNFSTDVKKIAQNILDASKQNTYASWTKAVNFDKWQQYQKTTGIDFFELNLDEKFDPNKSDISKVTDVDANVFKMMYYVGDVLDSLAADDFAKLKGEKIDKIDIALKYNDLVAEKGIYGFYHKQDAPFVYDCEGSQWNKIKVPDAAKNDFSSDTVTTRQLAAWAFENGYDAIRLDNIVDVGEYALQEARRPATVWAFKNPDSQLKSADPVTYDASGNIIPLSERFNTENTDIRYSVGYHAGDLGKSESLWQQGLDRVTGHFGTGTYFVGNKAAIEGYNSRNGKPAPVESVDFDKYNLFKPKSAGEGYVLHDFLRGVDGYWNRDTDAVNTMEEYESLQEKLSELVYDIESEEFGTTDPFKESWLDVEREFLLVAKRMMGDYRVGEELKDALDRLVDGNFQYDPRNEEYYSYDFETDQFTYYTEDEIIQKLNAEEGGWKAFEGIEKMADEYYSYSRTSRYETWSESIKEVAKVLGVSEQEIRDVIRSVTEDINSRGYTEADMKTADSAATRFMKALGYEGIDVRGIKELDNTTYGSVIYDLKDEDLARKNEIGTARFSISEEQDEAYMTAADWGDTETAQRMVDDAAKAAGYTLDVYHSTSAEFTEFKYEFVDIGYHVGTEEQAINRYKDVHEPFKVLHLYANPGNILYVADDAGDWHGKNAAEMLLEWETFEGHENETEIVAELSRIAQMPDSNDTDRTLTDYLISLGYDSIAYPNAVEGEGESYILFHAEQLKSADPVTYDDNDNGEVIPLSQRFNTENKDFRYSINYETGYEEGSTEDYVMKLVKAGNVDESIAHLKQWAKDYQDGKLTLSMDDQALADKLLSYKFVTEEEAEENRRKLDELIERYSELKTSANAKSPMHLPKKVKPLVGVSKYAQTLAENPDTPEWVREEIQKAIVDERAGFTHEIVSDKKAMAYVEKMCDEAGDDISTLMQKWDSVVGNNGILHVPSKGDIALGEYLYTQAIRRGDVPTVMKMVAELSAVGTQAGRTLQALTLLNKMTPAGQLYYLQKTVDRMNEKGVKKLTKKSKSDIKQLNSLKAQQHDAELAVEEAEAEYKEAVEAEEALRMAEGADAETRRAEKKLQKILDALDKVDSEVMMSEFEGVQGQLEEAKALEAEVRKAEKQLESAKKRLADKDIEAIKKKSFATKAELEKVKALEAEAKKAEADLRRAEKQLAAAKERLSKHDIDGTKAKLAETQEQIADIRAMRDEAKKAEAMLERAEARLDKLTEEWEMKADERARVAMALEETRNAIREAYDERADYRKLKEKLKRATATLNRLNTEWVKMKPERVRTEAELEAIKQRVAEARANLNLRKKELNDIKNAVKQFNADIEERNSKRWWGRKTNIITINTDLAEALLNAKTEEEIMEAKKALINDIADQVPTTWADVANAWRYMSMLLNPTTHGRNVFSNVAMYVTALTKDIVGATLETPVMLAEKAVSAVKGEPTEWEYRTKHMGEALTNLTYAASLGQWKADKYIKFAAADAKEMKDVLTGGGKHNPSDMIRDAVGKRIFQSKFGKVGKAFDFLSQGNSWLLEKEDWLFLNANYTRALSQYLASHKADVSTLTTTPEGLALLNKGRQWAVKEALEATFRDASAVASALNRLERSNAALGFIVGGVIPYKKTPINVAKRGVEYSPLGIIDTVKQLTKDEDKAAYTINSLAKTMTGTGLAYLGFMLAKWGLLRALGSDDEKEREFEELQGEQLYSLMLQNGGSYTLNWLAPSAMPILTGALWYETVTQGNDDLTLGEAAGVAMNLASPMFEMSFVDGLNRTLSSVKYAEDGKEVPALLGAVTTSYLGQFIPTFAKKIGRIVDDTRRTTYIDKNSDVPAELQRALQNITKDFRGDDAAPYIDAWGRADTESRLWVRLLENLLSPGYYENRETSAMEEELQRLYKVTGDVGVLPKSVSKYFNVDKARYDLSQEEWVTYQTVAGQGAYEMMTRLTNSRAYQNLTDEQKVKAVKDIYTYANEKGKEAAVSDYSTTESWIAKADKLADSGVSVEEYVVHSRITKDSDEDNVKDILGMGWLDDGDKALLIAEGYGKMLSKNTFTDPSRSGYEYSLTDAQTEQYVEYYDELWMEEYNDLISRSRFIRADMDEQTEMIKSLRSEVAEDTKKWMARQLRRDGIRSTKKD